MASEKIRRTAGVRREGQREKGREKRPGQGGKGRARKEGKGRGLDIFLPILLANAFSLAANYIASFD